MSTVTFRIRRDTATNWTSVNPVLKLGEPGLETDTRKVKYGDGATAWNALPYAGASLGAGLQAVDALTPAADRLPYFTGPTDAALATFTAFGRSVIAAVNAAAGRVALALGALATRDKINGNDWDGADLVIADGGTGASTAPVARTNLGLGTAATRDIGTSGAAVPLLSGANTWSGPQVIAGGYWAFTGSAAFPGVTSAGAYAYRSDALGLVLYGAGATSDFFLASRSGFKVIAVPAGTANAEFGGTALPEADGTLSLGTAARRWSGVFARNMSLFPPASVTPSTNGEMTFQLTNNTTLVLKARGTDGVVRSATLMLA